MLMGETEWRDASRIPFDGKGLEEQSSSSSGTAASSEEMVKGNDYLPLSQSESHLSNLTPITQSISASSEWDGSQTIKVGVRVRPLSSRETERPRHSRLSSLRSRKPDVADTRAWSISKSRKSDLISLKGARKVEGRSVFQFDSIFDEDSSTAQVYESMVRPILRGTLSGRNGTVFAYGQTSSGKTYTMQGSGTTYEDIGVIQMTTSDLFRWIEQESDHRDYRVRISFIEIYNEKVRDLLGKVKGKDGRKIAGAGRARSNAQIELPSLAVREDPRRGGVFVNCEEVEVEDSESVMELLRIGNQNRARATTNMNEQSSRSHAIFQIVLESREKEKVGGVDDGRIVRVSTLNLVDLAGSENGHSSATNGQRQREGGKINQSLLSLSQVIHALSQPAKKRPSHINYRDSKLTRILQPYLSGNALLAVLCCITVSKLFVEETRSTLKFAARAQLVQTSPKVNEILDDSALIKKLQRELAEATRALKELEMRETTLESIVFAEERPTESESCNALNHTVLNTSSVTTQTVTSNDILVLTPKRVNQSQETETTDQAVQHQRIVPSPQSGSSMHSSEPDRMPVTPESSDSRKIEAYAPSRECSAEDDVLSREFSSVDEERISPLQSRASRHVRTPNETPPVEVTILKERPTSPVVIAGDSPLERESQLYSKLMNEEKRSQFLQSRLDATEDLVEALLKDIESARKCIHQLVFKNVRLAHRLEKMRRRIDEQHDRHVLLKYAIYVGLLFFLSDQHETYLATVMFLWLSLEVMT